MAVGARDVLAGLSAVRVVSSAAAAEPRVVRIDDGVAPHARRRQRRRHAGGSGCRLRRDARRRALRVVSFAGERVRELHRGPHGTATAILSVAAAKDGATGLAYGLADGTLVVLSP